MYLKVLEYKSSVCWNFAFNYSYQANTCMHFTSTCFQYACFFNKFSLQSVTCFYHYSIGEYSTVHLSVTLQSKFCSTASRIWLLLLSNFGVWKLQI